MQFFVEHLAVGFDFGEVSEWLKEHAWKACGHRKVPPEFESLPLRFFRKTKKFLPERGELFCY